METTQKIQNELPHWFTQKAEARLQFLYSPEKTAELMDRLIARIKAFTDKFGSSVISVGKKALV